MTRKAGAFECVEYARRPAGSVHVEQPTPQAVSKNTQLFERLETTWAFEPDPGSVPPACFASIRVEFAFRSALYAQTSQLFLDEVAGAMLGAFERRCGVVPVATASRAALPHKLVQAAVADRKGGSVAALPADRPARAPHALREQQQQQERPSSPLSARRALPIAATPTPSRRSPVLPAPLPVPAPRPGSRIQRRATRLSPFPALPSDSLW